MTSGARPNLMDLFGTTDDELRSIMAEDLAGAPDDELLEGFWDAYRVLGGFLEVA